jgi:hypothetical protein
MVSEPVEGAFPPPPELPAELAAALHRAVAQSLGSLDSLRTTLRSHVHRERKRGSSLGDIDAQMRKMMTQADVNAGADRVASNAELATQITKWTRAFFHGTPS